MKIKVFRAADISQALSMIEAIEVVKNAFVQLSSKCGGRDVAPIFPLKIMGRERCCLYFVAIFKRRPLYNTDMVCF
jgi:hypothetical protein